VRYLDEYRDPARAKVLVSAIGREAHQKWVIMEVCGGQTHSFLRYGIQELLRESVEFLHGPGCPVCVTPLEQIDRALAIAARDDVIFCSFGDMLRVPGSSGDLLRLKSSGKDIRIVYSPLDAVRIAERNPNKEVVFFAIGFETTAPANAMAVLSARARRLTNFSALVSHVLTPPAMTAILQTAGNRVQAFLGPGHVCSVMGVREYASVAEAFHCPIVITGFEPLDLLEGVYRAVLQLEKGEARVEVPYGRAVREAGNLDARTAITQAFEVCDRKWRGVGSIPKSGMRLRYELRDFDAEKRFALEGIRTEEPAECQSGLVLRGLKRPTECPAFGKSCTPSHPLGATMVSSEGACAAYFSYGTTQVSA
jgi:hydrogenase expression/formation protein HypD